MERKASDSPTADAAAHARIAARLRDHAVEIQRLFAGLDEETLTRPTVAGKWSLKELLCHVGVRQSSSPSMNIMGVLIFSV